MTARPARPASRRDGAPRSGRVRQSLTKVARVPVMTLRAGRRMVTPLGWTTLLAALTAWVLGWYFGWRELLILATAGVIAVAGAALFSIARANLAVSISLDRSRVVVGERAVGSLAVTNRSRARLLPLQVDAPIGLDVLSVEVPSLATGATFDETFIVPTSRRAVVALGPARSIQGDPLGLVRRSVTWTGAVPLYVHPLTVRIDASVSGFVRDLEGRATKDLSPSDISFYALRDYVIGDDRRHVHWRSSARLGKLVIRQFVDTRRSLLGVVLDTDRAAYTDEVEFELAVSVAGSICRSALSGDQQVVCSAGADLVSALTPNALLDALAAVQMTSATSNMAPTADRRALAALEGASAVVVATGTGRPADEARRSAARYGSGAGIAVFRCGPAGVASRVRSAGNVTVVDIGALAELPRQTMAGVLL